MYISVAAVFELCLIIYIYPYTGACFQAITHAATHQTTKSRVQLRETGSGAVGDGGVDAQAPKVGVDRDEYEEIAPNVFRLKSEAVARRKEEEAAAAAELAVRSMTDIRTFCVLLTGITRLLECQKRHCMKSFRRTS